MGIDFLSSGKRKIKYPILKKIKSKQNNHFVWKKIIYYFSWLGTAFFSFFILSKIVNFISFRFLGERIVFNLSWLNHLDFPLFFFIIIDFIIINRVLSGKINEKFWLWFLTELLFLNFVWRLGMREYASQGIYNFNISLNYFVIAISFLLLKKVRENIVRFLKYFKGMVKEIESESGREITKEEKREKEFSKKFLKISKIPVLKSFVGWMYKNNKIVILSLLVLVILIGGVLRFDNLGKEALYHDQLIQYSAVMGVVKHGEAAIFNPITDELSRPYKRASLLTYFSAFLVKLFGNSEGVIKFPVALAGTLLIPIFYFFSLRFVSPLFALFGAMLIAFNPYLIYLSRFFRDYSLKIFFFFVTAILLARFIGRIQENKLDRDSFKILVITVPFLYFSYHFGSAETTLLSITFLIFVLGVMLSKSKKIITHNLIKTLLLSSVIVGTLLLIGSKLLGYLSIDNIRYIINTHITFDNLTFAAYGTEYQHYLFAYHLKNFIFIVLFISGIFLFIKKKWQHAFIFFQVGLGYYIIAYLGKRYEDFRYISFLIPLAILTMVISLQLFWRSLDSIQTSSYKKIVHILFIVILILIPTYFLPLKLPQASALSQFIALGQPWWQKDEGAIYVHRRAVAPQYKKAASYLNNNADFNNDIFVFTTSDYIYLKSIPINSFYAPRRNVYLQLLANRDVKIHYQRFLSQYKCKNIWFIGTHVHLLNRELMSAFSKNPKAIFIGAEIGIMHYNYNDFYINKEELTWPTLIKIPSSCNN